MLLLAAKSRMSAVQLAERPSWILDPQPPRIAGADRAHEAEPVGTGAPLAQAQSQAVAVDVVGPKP